MSIVLGLVFLLSAPEIFHISFKFNLLNIVNMKMIATQMIIIKLIQEATAECTNKNSACAVLRSLLVLNSFQYPSICNKKGLIFDSAKSCDNSNSSIVLPCMWQMRL